MFAFLNGFVSRKRQSPDQSQQQRRRNVRRRLVFDGGDEHASFNGFKALWTLPLPNTIGFGLAVSDHMFAEDAYIREEYVELYDLIRNEFASGRSHTALVRGSSGVGKSAFLQYFLSRIRDEVTDVLVVRGQSFNHLAIRFLHLSTNWWGRKVVKSIPSFEEAFEVEMRCCYTLVDGCDWEPKGGSFTVGAASPSTPWKGFRKTRGLLELCMPAWSLSQLEACAEKSGKSDDDAIRAIGENYSLVGGIARWALDTTTQNSIEQIDSATRRIDFETLQRVMATQHVTKNDDKELVHRLVEWVTPMDADGMQVYRVDQDHPIHFRLISDYAMKRLAEKAAALSIHKRTVLISELKEESAASAYRGALFEADVIDRLVCGGIFQIVKCGSEEEGARQEISVELSGTKRRYPMVSLDSLDVSEALDRIVVPDARNFESVDAFRVSSTPVFSANSGNCSPQYEIVGYQMTVGKSHPIKYRGVHEIVEKVKGSVPPTPWYRVL